MTAKVSVLLAAMGVVDLPARLPAAVGHYAAPSEQANRQTALPANEDKVMHGRAIVVRAGDMPKRTDTSQQPQLRPFLRRPHQLDTDLPIIIQGAPNSWALKKGATTG